MKIRQGFVSNSSSSSFVVCCRDWYPIGKNKNKRLITKEHEKKLIKYGFKVTELIDPLSIENDPLSLTKDVKIKKDDGYNYGFNVSCNQQDVIDFLTKNRIPFKAVTNYSNESIIYNGGETYFVIPNFGHKVSMYGPKNPKEVMMEFILGTPLISEHFVKDVKDSFYKRIIKAKEEQ